MALSLRPLARFSLALFLLAVPCLAVDVIKVKGLGVLRGEATAYDKEAGILTFVTEEGVEHKIPKDDLDRLSAYKLAKTKVDLKSAEELVKLGNFARSIELYAYAGRHYIAALVLDPGMKDNIAQEQAVNRREASEFCMRQAREAITRNDVHGAEKWLTTMVDKLPDEPLSQQAASMLAEHYKKNHGAKDDELEAKYKGELEKDLKKGKGYYDNMLKRIETGLTSGGSGSAAKRDFETAWTDGERALGELDKVQKKNSGDAQLAELFDGYRELITEHMVSSQLHLAASYSVQTSYNQALKTLNRALSIDPTNKEVLAARARAEEAVSSGGLFRRWW